MYRSTTTTTTTNTTATTTATTTTATTATTTTAAPAPAPTAHYSCTKARYLLGPSASDIQQHSHTAVEGWSGDDGSHRGGRGVGEERNARKQGWSGIQKSDYRKHVVVKPEMIRGGQFVEATTAQHTCPSMEREKYRYHEFMAGKVFSSNLKNQIPQSQ